MTIGRCNDCGGRNHKFAIYEWTTALPLSRAVCPIHGTPLARTTYGGGGRRRNRGKLVKLGYVSPNRQDRGLLPRAPSTVGKLYDALFGIDPEVAS